MLLIDTIFFLFLGLYLDQVLQSQFGVAKKWYFLCTRKFWCGDKRKKRTSEDNAANEYLLNSEVEVSDNLDEHNPHDFEAVPEQIKRQEQTKECLKIRGLRKEFGPKIAVQNSNVTMYNGQIFALLGHNGAGKTTTISMLTGLIQASAGKASAQGINIFEEMDDFRKILGVCP